MNKNLSALELTQALVRFDTINPPGNERLWAEHLGSPVAALEPAARAARALGWACRVVNGHVPGDPDPTAARVRMLLSALQRLR